MKIITTTLTAIVVFVVIFSAYALCKDDPLETLCAAQGWPSDSQMAYERACNDELRRLT